MSKRPYYLISHHIDCDGYSSYIDYLGVNPLAAIRRFQHITSEMRKRFFLDEGIDEEHIYYGNGQDWADMLSLQPEDINTPGKAYTFYMNDDNCCWLHVKLSVIETGEFFHYPQEGRWDNGRTVWSDNMRREEEYKALHPNAKY